MYYITTVTYVFKDINLERKYLGTGESYHKVRHITLAVADIRRRMTSLYTLYYVNLTFVINVKRFLVKHLH